MSSVFFVGESGDTVAELLPVPFKQEEDLQKLIANSPRVLDSALTGDTRWKLIAREFKVPGSSGKYSLDALFVDQDGVPVLAEVKRASDVRIRREILGQLIDYITKFEMHMDSASLRARFEQSCLARQTTSEAELDDLLAGGSREGFWDQVQTNIKEGRLHIAVVADEVPDDLKENIAALNKKMPALTFSAIAVRQYGGKDGAVRVVVSEDTATSSYTKASATFTSLRAGSEKTSSQPSNWEEAVRYIQSPEMQGMLLKQAQEQPGYVGLRKINYEVDGVRRWRLKVQKKDVNLFQHMRFTGDLKRWRELFPELASEIRVLDGGRALAFNLRTPDQLCRFVDFAKAAKSNPESLQFLPRGAIGDLA
jgi:hypothetical protein